MIDVIDTLPKELKKGDTIILYEGIRTITHIKKSRRYAGFYEIQFFDDPLPNGSYTATLKWNATVEQIVST